MSADAVIETVVCPDGAVITIRAAGDRWSWTCNQHPSGAHGTQQDVVRDADWHTDQHTPAGVQAPPNLEGTL